MSEPVGFEINISIFNLTDKEAEGLHDHLSEEVCEYFGGHEQDGEVGCPAEFVAGLKPIRDEEPMEAIGASPDENGMLLHLANGESVHLCWCRLNLLTEDAEGKSCEVHS